jgi:hypothetical protein
MKKNQMKNNNYFTLSKNIKEEEAGGRLKNSHLPLIHSFLNKHVCVKVDDGLTVEGVLIRYQNEDKARHLPNILILKNGNSYYILRGNYQHISEVAI